MKKFKQLRKSLQYESMDICPVCDHDPCICETGQHIEEATDMCNVCGQTPCNCTHISVNEKAEQIDEVSYGTLQSYRSKAHTQIQHYKHASGQNKPEAETVLAKREKGMASATKKVIAVQDKQRTPIVPQKAAPYKPLGGYDPKSGKSYSESVEQGVAEETELGDLAHPKTMKHRFLVTFSEPMHADVSKRKEKQKKQLIVPSTHNGETVYKADAEIAAKKHMKKQGYKVHSIEHVGMVERRVNESEE